MNERIRESMDYVKLMYRYDIDESTLTVLSEEREHWVANATTTHLQASGEEEVSLVILVQGYDCKVIPGEIVSSLSQWLAQHWTVAEE